jgi:ABC-type transport system involved in multi-copper enzyme maturation permease subunit
MISTRFMELRRRRGLMIVLIAVNIGIPTVFLAVRLVAHAVAPHSYGPAGGYDIFTSMVAGVMFIFGFIVAATLGCTAGSVDLTEGMFRHLVVTGRSRLALYVARIPAGLAIIVPLVAIGFTVVCAVCVFAAPAQLSFNDVNVPVGLSQPALEKWAAGHADEVICNFGFNIGPNSDLLRAVNSVPCGGGNGPSAKVGPGALAPTSPAASPAQIEDAAKKIASLNYSDYSGRFLSPSVSLMVRTGLWIELYAAIGFLVGLGLASLMGQRTVPVILLIVLEVVLTPLLSQTPIHHLVNLQRSLLGLAATHFEPGGLPSVFGGGHNNGIARAAISESTTFAVCVLVGWVVVWTVLGAWRMVTRDA